MDKPLRMNLGFLKPFQYLVKQGFDVVTVLRSYPFGMRISMAIFKFATQNLNPEVAKRLMDALFHHVSITCLLIAQR